MLCLLNMAPSTMDRNNKWFFKPWVAESKDHSSGFTYKPTNRLIPGEDGDTRIMRVTIEDATDESFSSTLNTSEGTVVDDELNAVELLQHEAQDVITEVLTEGSNKAPEGSVDNSMEMVKYSLIMRLNGKSVYKSTLVNELNGNPFLLKDRLIWICNSVYFNNFEDYLSAAASSFI
jgi:hypothetical protein